MLLNLMLTNLWVSLAVFNLLYICDYFMTLWQAHIYRKGVSEHFVFEKGIELNPIFKKDIASLRVISPRLILNLLLISILLAALWAMIVYWRIFPAQIYEFVYGGVILTFVMVNVRHIRNILYYREIVKGGGVSGRVEITMALSLRQSMHDVFGFVILYLVVYSLTGVILFAGGALFCLVNMSTHLKWLRRDKSESAGAGEGAEGK